MGKKVALITGAAKRIGSTIAKHLHENGFNVIVHYNHSKGEAEALKEKLNASRSNSATLIAGNINLVTECQRIVQDASNWQGRLDVLINNASSFYPTSMGKISEGEWEDLLGSNLKGPFFLAQEANHLLKKNSGSIINIADIHGEHPLKDYPVYCIAKAGLIMMTKTLAKELGPEVRVNAISPGPVLWPDEMPEETKYKIIKKTCLKRKGAPEDIAKTVLFLIEESYITGQIIAIDGGRSI